MDRISDLPDEILCQILSLFPTKEAASTSVLSKRWRNLFAFSPNLSFEQREKVPKVNYVKPEGEITSSFVDFVDRVLAVSDNSTIKKFSLSIRKSVKPHINRWMNNLLSRGIVDLKLEYKTENVTTLPLEIFICKTIVYLHLGNLIRIPMVPANAYLPALKTLFLGCVLYSGSEFEALISVCPVLERLVLFRYPLDWNHDQNALSYTTVISCPTLTWLHLTCRVYCDVSQSITFDTPKVTSLVYRDFVANEYPVVKLDSLVRAEISLTMSSTREGNPKNLIKGLRNVKILNFSSLETSEVFYSFAKEIPMFKNLTHLTIASVFPSVGWKLIPILLKKALNLETLVIQGPCIFEDEYNYGEESEALARECLSECTSLSSCLVKVLEITRYRGAKGELEQIKHFVEKLPCLELVNIRACFGVNVTFTTDMLMLPKASKILIKFFPCKTKK